MFRRALRLAATAAVALVAAAPPALAQSATGARPSVDPGHLVASIGGPALLAVPAVPAAPAATTAGVRDTVSAPAVGPRLDGAGVAVGAHERAPATAGGELTAQPRRSGLQQSQVLMIVGGGAFLAGAIIGDDAGTIIMIGGAAVALYGLYQYLQTQ
jgi:hypothetical protein